MPSTDQRNTPAAASAASLQRSLLAPSTRTHSELDLSPESRSRLEGLLRADVVDLRKVCEEIHSAPLLANLVAKLGGSVGASASSARATVEEAVVLLGADRLRVLVNAWPFTQTNRRSKSRSEKFASEPASVSSRGARTDEPARAESKLGTLDELRDRDMRPFTARTSSLELIPYGLRDLLDVVISRPALHAEQIDGMVETLARDFVALAPLIESAGSARRKQSPASTVRSSSRRIVE